LFASDFVAPQRANSTSQRKRKNKEDYRELAVAIMDVVAIIQDELQAVEQREGSRFWTLCLAFNKYVCRRFIHWIHNKTQKTTVHYNVSCSFLSDVLHHIQEHNRMHWSARLFKTASIQEEINNFKESLNNQRANLNVSCDKLFTTLFI
jgi:hypothetical protein